MLLLDVFSLELIEVDLSIFGPWAPAEPLTDVHREEKQNQNKKEVSDDYVSTKPDIRLDVFDEDLGRLSQQLFHLVPFAAHF